MGRMPPTPSVSGSPTSDFRGMPRSKRDALVFPLLRGLPEETQSDITLLLLTAPGEECNALMNLEFEQPSPAKR